MEPVIVTLIVFGSTGIILWKFMESRHREKMAMIEKGVSPADFKGMSLRDVFRLNPLSSLKWGLLAMFVGLGVFFAERMEQLFYWHDSVYPASMLMSGGLALVIFYLIAARKTKREDE